MCAGAGLLLATALCGCANASSAPHAATLTPGAVSSASSLRSTDPAAGPSTSSRPTSSPRSTAAPSTPSPSPRPSSSTPAQVRARVDAAVAKLRSGQPAGAVSVAAVDETTGRTYSAGATSGMRMVSVYKLFVIESLLLQDDELSDGEQTAAVAALQHSDNVAGYQLFMDGGGLSGLTAGARRLSMTHTDPAGDDPTFTTTSAPDALHLLEALVEHGSPLGAEARSFVLEQMREVEADQRWGVGAVADKGSTSYNKNGWLSIDDDNPPTERDDDLWAVNSVGIVTVHGDKVLLALFTQHQPSFERGVTLVEQLARTITPAVTAR